MLNKHILAGSNSKKNEFYRYGYLTWEWTHAIRSYLYVSWIALVYQILKIFELDSVHNLVSRTLILLTPDVPFPQLIRIHHFKVWLPSIIQTIFSAISDTYFISWVYKVSSKRQAYWSVWCYMTNVFLAYCATRTLTNTLETNLTCIALYYYPWARRETGEYGQVERPKLLSRCLVIDFCLQVMWNIYGSCVWRVLLNQQLLWYGHRYAYMRYTSL